MTTKETIIRVKEKDYYDRWILPGNGLNTEEALKAYAGRPIGNSPEMMLWDCSLNHDVKQAVHRHVVFTSDLPEHDPNKPSMSTPKRGSSAWIRLENPEIGGVPCKRRIVEDVLKVVESVEGIRK
jgi:hypothetical protein